MSAYCPECLHPHGRYEACGPAFTSECVICDACIGPEDSGLCDAHKYDEQLADTCESLECAERGCYAESVGASEYCRAPAVLGLRKIEPEPKEQQ